MWRLPPAAVILTLRNSRFTNLSIAILHIDRIANDNSCKNLRNFERLLRRLSEDFSEDFLESLLMHFMLEDFPRSLQEVFRNLLPKVTSGIILGRISEDFLENLLVYFRLEDFPRSLQKVFQSLLPKVVQRDDVKWSPSLSIRLLGKSTWRILQKKSSLSLPEVFSMSQEVCWELIDETKPPLSLSCPCSPIPSWISSSPSTETGATMVVVSREDHFREPPQTPSSFSALCQLLRHDRTTSAFLCDVFVFLVVFVKILSHDNRS
ncbi:hypothetical protein YC2023_010748 [Brassica napus]